MWLFGLFQPLWRWGKFRDEQGMTLPSHWTPTQPAVYAPPGKPRELRAWREGTKVRAWSRRGGMVFGAGQGRITGMWSQMAVCVGKKALCRLAPWLSL